MSKLKNFSINLVIISILIIPIFIFAQTPGGVNPTNPGGVNPSTNNIGINIPNPTNAGNDLMSLLTAILNKVVMPIAAVAVTIWIIWAGFSYVLAQGNPAKIEKAHQRLLWSLIGAGILLGAAGISLVVQHTIQALL